MIKNVTFSLKPLLVEVYHCAICVVHLAAPEFETMPE